MGLLEPQHIIFVCFIITAIWGYRAGAKRKVGGAAGLFLGLILGPIGIIIIYCFDKIEKLPIESIPDQLKKFKDLLDSSAITEAEYNVQKAKILNS